MTSPPEEITLTCPDCKRVYKDWYRPSINLGHWRQLTCYLPGFVVYFGSLVSHSLRPKRARVADGRGLVANGS